MCVCLYVYLCVYICVWVSYYPRVNGQGLYSISPLRKHGRVSHPQSMNMSSSYLNLLCLFTKFEECCYAQTIFMKVLEDHLDIHNDFFQIEGAMTE